MELLDAEAATVWPEVEAKIADSRWPTLPTTVDPNHLSTARRELIVAGDIEEVDRVTRGGPGGLGRPVTFQRRPLIWGRGRPFAVAAQRKGLLYSRFQGWAQPTVRHPLGLVGRAGEAVQRASLRAAAVEGRYSLIHPSGREVSHLAGIEIPGGPVDDAAVLLAVENGMPTTPVHVLIEDKNVRHWVYPGSVELYQLLRKAVLLQGSLPGTLVLPVLVCRRRHFTTLKMGVDLGFYVIEVRRQYVLPRAGIHGNAFAAVRDGLGYQDLVLSDTADTNLTSIFRDTLPRDAAALARRWQERALDPTFAALVTLIGGAGRVQARSLNALRARARQLPNSLGGW